MAIIDGGLNQIQNKHALITGGGGEIGVTLANTLREKGFELTIWGHRSDYDLSRPEETDRAIKEVLKGKEITHFFHLASPLPSEAGYFSDSRFYNVNVDAFVRITRALAPSMIKHRRGYVLAFGSLLALSPNADDLGIEYNIAKAGLLNYSLHLAKKYNQTGIRVLYLAPSIVDTSFHAGSSFPKIPKEVLIEHIMDSIGDPIRFSNGSIVGIPAGGKSISVGGLEIAVRDSSRATVSHQHPSAPDQAIRRRVAEIFKKVFPTLKESSEADLEFATMESVADWDSLRHLSLVVELDSSFEMSIPTQVVPEIVSFNKICELIRDHAPGL